jgi:lipocalin
MSKTTMTKEIANWIKEDLKDYFYKLNYKTGKEITKKDKEVNIEFVCSEAKRNIKDIKQAIIIKLKYLREDILEQFELPKDSYVGVRVNNYLGKWYVDVHVDF